MSQPDTIQAFETYVAFNGDLARTSVALNISREEVQGMAIAGGWEAKAREWQTLREGSTQDVSIQVNRAVNFVQAHRLRSLVDKVVTQLCALSADELVDKMSSKNNHGTTFSARQLTDLVKAAEAAHLMTQRALGDTAQERPESAEGRKGSSIALLVQAAMTAADNLGVDSLQVVKDQMKLAPPSNDAPKAN